LMTGLFEDGYGGEMHIDSDRVGITWATFGHLYSDYYVFQYATGISAAHALAGRVLAGGPAAAEDYLSFLRAGGSVYPLDALKLGGVDLTTPQAVEETYRVLDGYVDRLEGLLLK
jgi:oligoendopeptidase F